jgi:tRNA-specific 2-thiouridylase
MAKAVALLSGGLDSQLAILLMRRQNIEVTAITFLMHFGCDMGDTSSCSSDASSTAAEFGFEVKLCHLADKFTEIVKNPKFGHGKNMNPCIDCRILMLKEAKEFMRMSGADFIVTGEVLGQRPMSQRRDTFPVIDREAGVKGYVLRPLSAKLMKPTIPEEQGLVDREQLCDFAGRGRKAQMALARNLGLEDYPAPAGGCLLTDPIYSFRLRELMQHSPDPTLRELNLLRLGRHFRLPGGLKAVVGRDEKENNKIEAYAEKGDYLFWLDDFGSPTVLIDASASEQDIETAARLCVRFSDAKKLPEAEVTIDRDGEIRKILTAPIPNAELEAMRVHFQPVGKKKRKAVRVS